MTENIILDIYRIGSKILDYLDPVLSWFFSPIDWPEWAGAVPDYWHNLSPVNLIFGGGIIFLLGFILVKFVLDIIL